MAFTHSQLISLSFRTKFFVHSLHAIAQDCIKLETIIILISFSITKTIRLLVDHTPVRVSESGCKN